MNNRLRRYLLSVIICLVFTTVTGCGETKKELDSYRTSMEDYYNEAANYNDAINNIDPTADDAGDQLLKQLDGLNSATKKMSGLTVPKQFESTKTLAEDASNYMDQAVKLYHQAYSADPYDPNLADEGRQYYERANKRIAYILLILHGEAPAADTTAETATITAAESSAGTDSGTTTQNSTAAAQTDTATTSEN